MKRLSHLLLLPFLLLLADCGDSQTGSDAQTGTTSENTGRSTDGEQQAMEVELEKFDKRLESLKAEAAKLGDRAKAELDELIQKLETQMRVAEQRLEEFKSAGAEAWREAKSKADSAMKDLEEFYDRAISRLKEST